MGALADIIRRHGPAYVQKFAARMPPAHRRVLRALARCRTPEAGGQLWHCPTCRQQHAACHSCGNRHCPTCGGDDARLWLDRQLQLQLPVPYFLCTFTVPETLRNAIASVPSERLSLLYAASSSALLDLCANPKWFGATPGATAMLHTWTRAMAYHPHIHYLVTGGGFDKKGTWRWPKKGFLVPAHALSRLFRKRFKEGLRKTAPQVFSNIPTRTWTQDWVVHVKNVGDGANALRYLARYIYRVALTDSAILHHDATSVAFRYRDSDTGRSRKMELPAFAFLQRFLQHVLPKGFVKVRYFGLHHPANHTKLAMARASLYLHLKQPLPPPPPPTPEKSPLRCRSCKTPLIPGLRFHPGQLPPSHAPPCP